MIYQSIKSYILFKRGGQDVEFHYYNRPFFSLHQKFLFSWSLLRHHYIENGFLVDHYYDITTSKISVFLVHHYYKNQNSEKNEKNIENLSFV